MELRLDIVGCCVGLNDFYTTKRLVEHTHQIAHTLLAMACRVTQLLDDMANDEAHQRQEEGREDGQLPRYIDHQHKVADDKERLAECHLQSVGHAILHRTNVGGNSRYNIALTLTAEIAYILTYNAVEHSVTNTLHGIYTHLLHRISTQVAEEVRQQVHNDKHHSQHHKHIGYAPLRTK